MAGNIIPAIATANAMVASLVVFQAVNVLSGNVKACRTVYVRRDANHKGEILAPERNLLPPLPTCFICSSKPEITLSVDVSKVTLKQFNEDVLKKSLNLIEPEVTISESCRIILTSEDEYEDEYLNRPLSEFGIKEGILVYVDDFLQTCKFYIKITERHVESDREESLFEVIQNADIKATQDKDPKEGTTNGHADGELDNVDVVVVENGGDADLLPSRKRKSEIIDGVRDKKVKTQ